MLENNLRKVREELDMTQEEIGNIFNVSRKTVSGWETSNNPIPFDKLIKFCNLYHYSMDYIVGLSNNSNKIDTNIKEDRKEIGKRLKTFRKSLGVSQLKFAEKCGLSQTTYSHYETGLNLITTINAYAIGKTYNISIDYLVGRVDDPKIR